MSLKHTVKKNTGLKGLADLQIMRASLRVHFVNDGAIYDVELDERIKENGRYVVTLDKTNTQIKFINVPGRQEPFFVRFLEFGNRDRELNIPNAKTNPAHMVTKKDGTTYPADEQLEYFARLEILDPGPYEGMTINWTIPYIFEPEPGTTQMGLVGKSGQITRNEEFLQTCGFDFQADSIPVTVNPLPFLEGLLRYKNVVFAAYLKPDSGFFDHASPLQTSMLPPDIKAKIAPKKSSKKVVAKTAPKPIKRQPVMVAKASKKSAKK